MVDFTTKKWFAIELCILGATLATISLITHYIYGSMPTGNWSEMLTKTAVWGLTTELSFALFLFCWVLIFRKKLGVTRQNLGYQKIHKPESDLWFYYALIIIFTLGVVGFIGLVALGLVTLPVEMSVLLLSFAYACICAPVVEEFIFRGYLYKRSSDIFENQKWEFDYRFLHWFPFSLFKTYDLFYATLLTSILFGVFHLVGGLSLDNLVQVAYTFVGGLFFCRFKNQTQSIFTTILFHAAWNGAMGLIGIVAISWGYV